MSSFWKIGAIVGVCLTAIGLSAVYLPRYVDLLGWNLDFFISTLLVGILSAFVCLIGWATTFGKGTRARAAAIVLISPWALLLISERAGNFNIHGPSVFLYYVVVPVATILALVLFVMAAFSKQD